MLHANSATYSHPQSGKDFVKGTRTAQRGVSLSTNRMGAILYGLLLGALTVVVIIVVHGLRHGWGELTEPGYWVEKAVIFVIMAAVFAAFASFQRPGGKP
jgi:hypothetical protein